MNEFKGAIILSNVNTLLGSVFLAAFATGAGLLIWNAAYGVNPLANVFYAEMYQVTRAAQ